MSSGEDWQRQVRRARAAQRAAQRRHPASGRGHPRAVQPGMLRIVPDRQPATPTEETDMPDHQDQAAMPDDAEHRPGLPPSPLLRELVDDGTRNPPASWAEAVRTPDVKPALDQHTPSPWELAARMFEQPRSGDQ